MSYLDGLTLRRQRKNKTFRLIFVKITPIGGISFEKIQLLFKFEASTLRLWCRLDTNSNSIDLCKGARHFFKAGQRRHVMSEKKFNNCPPIATSGTHAYARTIGLGEALDVWALSPICEQSFPGQPGLLVDPQNYRFINGFVAVGDLPCRKAFRATMVGRDVPFDDRWPVSHLRLPGAGSRIDFSEFWYRPTHLSRWASTILDTPETIEAAFRSDDQWRHSPVRGWNRGGSI